MKKKVLAIMLVAMSIMLISACGKKEKLYEIPDLSQYKTDYVGDSSNVINIVSGQEYPAGYSYDSIEIPNISQANRLKRMSQQKCLDMDKIYEILQEIKSNQKEQIKLPLERIGKYFPTAYTPKQQVDLIEKLLKNWAKQNVK